jgi:hypothetical protein
MVFGLMQFCASVHAAADWLTERQRGEVLGAIKKYGQLPFVGSYLKSASHRKVKSRIQKN